MRRETDRDKRKIRMPNSSKTVRQMKQNQLHLQGEGDVFSFEVRKISDSTYPDRKQIEFSIYDPMDPSTKYVSRVSFDRRKFRQDGISELEMTYEQAERLVQDAIKKFYKEEVEHEIKEKV